MVKSQRQKEREREQGISGTVEHILICLGENKEYVDILRTQKQKSPAEKPCCSAEKVLVKLVNKVYITHKSQSAIFAHGHPFHPGLFEPNCQLKRQF